MEELPVSNLLRSIMIKSQWAMEAKLKEFEITQQQARAIAYVIDNEEHGVIQKDMADAFQRRGASITSLLKGLESRGYIERRIPKDNERQKMIYSLPKGRALSDTINQSFKEAEKNLLTPLDEAERQELIRLLKKLDSHL